MESRTTASFLRIWTLLVVVFLYVPLALIVLYAFNRSNVQTWPIKDYSTHWFSVAWNDQEVRDAFVLSLKVACAATAVALVLGTAASFAVARYRFFGVNSVSFLVVIPIALPGVITGIALQSSFAIAGIPFSLWTIMIGHATFCIVIVFNNVVARLRRMSPSIEDASMDLGANGLQTFRYILLPELRSALVAGCAARVRAVLGRGHRDHLHRRRQHDHPDLDLDGPAHRRQRLRDQRRRRRRGTAQHRAGLLRPASDERSGHARRRLAVVLMAARALGWVLLAVAPRLRGDGLRHEQLDDERRPGRPLRA